jgi:hypothetical protein
MNQTNKEIKYFVLQNVLQYQVEIENHTYNVHVGTKGVIRRCKSKEDRQCNDLKKNDHRQTIIHTCRYWRCNQKM